MEIWGCTIAVAIPTAFATLISCYIKRRSLVVAGFIGALLGLLFRGLSSAIHDDPLDTLKRTISDSLPGTMLFSAFGLMAAGVMLYRNYRTASGSQRGCQLRTH